MATSVNGRLSDVVEARTQCLHRELQRAGEVLESPTHLAFDGLTIATASDVGGKRINQDSALLFVPTDNSLLRWAAALSDGVSSSVHSGEASSFACHAALAALRRTYLPKTSCMSRCRVPLVDRLVSRTQRLCSPRLVPPNPAPLAAAAAALNKFGRSVRRSPERFWPQGLTHSSWQRVLRDSRYLQTTLMVAWQVGDQLRLEGVGDGGFAIHFSPDSEPLVYQPSSSGPVDCLGPDRPLSNRGYRITFDRWHSLAVYTDGVTPALDEHPHLVQAALCRSRARTNAASVVLRWMLRNRPELIEDNISLLLAKSGA